MPPPPGTRSLALLLVDPDAPGGEFVHWVIYDLSPTTRGLPAGGPLPVESRQGSNGFDHIGYGGPCPARGQSHHYVLTLYALGVAPALGPGATAAAFRTAVAGTVVQTARLTGTYGR